MTLTQNDKRLPRTRGSSLYFCAVVAMAVLYALISAFTPYYLDDWAFMGNWRDDAANGYGFSWEGWWRYYDFIRGYDNGRLANAVSPLSTMFSPWKEMFPLLVGSLMAYIAVVLERLVLPKGSDDSRSDYGRRILFLGITWVLMIVCLPWQDTLFVRDYSLNYIFSAALTLSLLWALKALSRGYRCFVLALLLAVLAGGWHEGFAVPTLCGLFLLITLKKREPRIFIIVGVYLATTMVFALSPGLVGRAMEAVGSSSHVLSLRRPLLIFAIDLVLVVILLATEKGRTAQCVKRLFRSPVVLVCLGIMVSGYAIGFLTVNTPRSYFWADMGGIGLALWLINGLMSKVKWRRSNLRAYLAGGALLVLCVAQTLSVLVWQMRYARETEEIMALLDRSESGTVFYDSRLPEKAPAYTLGIPVSNAWHNPYHYRSLWSYYMTPVIGVVPESMRYATRENTESDTVGMTIPDYVDGYVVYPFVSASGDTLLYREKN